MEGPFAADSGRDVEGGPPGPPKIAVEESSELRPQNGFMPSTKRSKFAEAQARRRQQRKMVGSVPVVSNPHGPVPGGRLPSSSLSSSNGPLTLASSSGSDDPLHTALAQNLAPGRDYRTLSMGSSVPSSGSSLNSASPFASAGGRQRLRSSSNLSASSRVLAKSGLPATFNPVAEAREGPPPPLDLSDLRSFITSPAPLGRAVQARVYRDRKGFKKWQFPEYQMILEADEGADEDTFLMAARKRKKSKTAHYLISMDKLDLARESINFLGKVKSNFVGTEYNIYDKGFNPDNGMPEDLEEMGVRNIRQQLATILFESTAMKLAGAPRQMTTLIPAVTAEDHARVPWAPISPAQTLLAKYQAGETDDMVVLENKKPQWREDLQSHVLDFGGRVTLSSVKNFQLVHPEDDSYILVQFGKIDSHAFTLDFQYPISPLQAFGLALTAIDSKLACE